MVPFTSLVPIFKNRVFQCELFKDYEVQVAALSTETLFVIMSSSMREKERDDLSTIMSHTSPEKIMARFAALWLTQKPRVAREALVNIIGEMQLVLEKTATIDWFGLVP
ncbi:MAG: hypothetical protein ACYCYP_13315 [Leptospirales bacterium]